MVQLHISIFLFGLVGLFGKFFTIPAPTIVFGRTVLASGVLLLALMYRDGRKSTDQITNALGLIPSGALLALHWFTFFYSIQISSVATGLLAVATFPIFVALLEPLSSRRRPQAFDLASAAVVFAGLTLVVPEYDFRNRFFQGLLWGLFSAFSFTLLTLFNQRFVQKSDALVVGLFQNFWAAVCLIPWALPILSLDSSGWALMIFLGVFCTALAHTLFISALTEIRPQLASMAAGLEPVYGIALAALILGEFPGVRELAGGALIVGAVIVASLRRAHDEPRKSQIIPHLH